MTILLKENIVTSSNLQNKKEVIHFIAERLYKYNYVTQDFETAMLEKEKVFDTAIGFGVAIPHAIETMKDTILRSGLVIMTFPNGLQWGEKIVKFVVAIAATGDEHMELLSKIALSCTSEEEVDQLSKLSQDQLFQMFS